MSVKRLAISFTAVVVLLFVAAVLQLLILIFPAQTEPPSSDEPEAVSSVSTQSGSLWSDGIMQVSQRAMGLMSNGDIAVDGESMPAELALTIAQNQDDYSQRVGYLDQYDNLASGCEIIALCVAFEAEGFSAEPTDIARDYLRLGYDIETDYRGDPWGDGGGYPLVIADAANDWLDANGGGARAYDLSGTTFEGVLNLVYYGYPVLVWTTEDMEEPEFSGDPDDPSSWYYPQHCVVVYGIGGGEVFVSDSLEGLVRRDLADFASIYAECGNRALIVVPDGAE